MHATFVGMTVIASACDEPVILVGAEMPRQLKACAMQISQDSRATAVLRKQGPRFCLHRQ